MKKYCSIDYCHGGKGLVFDSVLDLGIRLRNARDFVKDKYGESVSEITVYITNSRNFSVSFSSDNIVEPLRDFINLSGVPYFVSSSSDYNLVNKVLHEHGKKLKRKGHGCGVGKWVVDDNLKQPRTLSNIWSVISGRNNLGL